jgi:hypothetical protein
MQELLVNAFHLFILNFEESRIYVLNTLFSLPEIYLLACLINYFTTSPHFEQLVFLFLFFLLLKTSSN